jgi:hypothetical protein
MGVVGNALASVAGDIGGWIDKNIFRGSGARGRSIGEASSNLIRMLPFDAGGKITKQHMGQAHMKKKAPAKKGRGKKKM